MRFLPYFLLQSLILHNAFAQHDQLTLHYDAPAEVWTEALPIGNSYLGGMIFGDPFEEHIQLNESTLYSGDPHRKYEGYTYHLHILYQLLSLLIQAENIVHHLFLTINRNISMQYR